MIELYFPTETGEQAAFVAAAVIAVIGFVTLFFPATVLRLAAFQVGEVRAEGYAGIRSVGGHLLGLGLAAILLGQDWIYLTLGVALGFGVFGRLVSALFDRGLTLRNLLLLLAHAGLAAPLLAYGLGYL